MSPSDRKAAAKVIDKDKDYDATMDEEEPTSAELVEMLRESLKQAEAGQTRPIEELLRELDEILEEDGAAAKNH